MKPLNSNKFFLLMAASALTGVIVAATALASPNQPEAYERLSAVEMNDGQTPQLNGGLSALSGEERRYAERLPVQLQGPMKKAKRATYKHGKPSKRSHQIRVVKKSKSKTFKS